MVISCCLPCAQLRETRELRLATLQNTPKYVPKIDRCKVVSVYDGDTITVAAKLEGPFGLRAQLFRVRLARIDTPEMKGKGVTAFEKELAIRARDALAERILHKIVRLEKVGVEKYGRVLADVIYKGENMNDWLLAKKYAKPYDGGKKDSVWGDMSKI